MKTFQILHLKRRSGTAEILLPFTEKTVTLDDWENSRLVGFYGTEPKPESLTRLRQKLYDVLEDSLLSWHSERQFIPRFLLASLAFFVAYFLLTLGLRLPLHFAFKFLLALGLGAGVYFLLGRRDSRAEAVSRRRLELREKIDQTQFQADPRVLDLETQLQTLENLDELGLSQVLVNPPERPDPDGAFAVGAFGRPWSQLLAELSEKRRRWALLTPERAAVEVDRWLKKKKVDAAMLALAVVVEGSARSVHKD